MAGKSKSVVTVKSSSVENQQPALPGLKLPDEGKWEEKPPFRQRVIAKYQFETVNGERDLITLTEHEVGGCSNFVIAESKLEGTIAYMYPDQTVFVLPNPNKTKARMYPKIERTVYHTEEAGRRYDKKPPDEKSLLPGIDWSQFIPPKLGDWHPYQERLLEKAFPTRKCTWNAFKDLMERLCDRHLPGKPIVAEIGPGVGFPYAVMPERVKENWVLVEWNPRYADELRRRFPGADVREGNAESLPFLPDILDGVFGYGSYDTIRDIRRAIASAASSLKRGGVFMHVLDTNPDPDAVREWMKQEGRFFPKVMQGALCTGVTGVGEDDIYFKSESILRQYNEARAQDLKNFGVEEEYGKTSGGLLKKYGKRVDFRVEFKRIMCRLLEENGFYIELDGRVGGDWNGPREKRHYLKNPTFWNFPDEPEYNLLKQFEGVEYVMGHAEPKGFLEGKPTPKTIREHVEVDVIAARKKL